MELEANNSAAVITTSSPEHAARDETELDLAATGPSTCSPQNSNTGQQNQHQQQHAAATSSRVSFAFNSEHEASTTTVDAKDTFTTTSSESQQPGALLLLVHRSKLGCPSHQDNKSVRTGRNNFSFALDKRRKFFQVHSRRRSIWCLNELEQQQHQQPQQQDIKLKDSCLINSDCTQQRSSSFGQQYKPQTLFTQSNYTNAILSSSKLHRESNELPIDQQKDSIRKAETNMSQTLQSIQSLSMQLNRAASLSGSAQLDDLIDSTGGSSPRIGQHQDSSAPELGPSNKLTRLVGKKAARVKEILLQNLGKADKTTDELFKIYEENFYKQQAQASKLQKEFKSYIQALKGAQDAGKSLHYFIQQSTIDYQSARHDLVCENLSQLEHLNEDLMDKLRGQVLISVNEYLTQFKELRVKIAKRRRKQIDFDSSRRVYELALASVNKKRIQQQSSQVNLQQHQSGAQAARGFRSSFFLTSSQQGACNGEDGIQSATSQLVDEARLLKLREQYNYCKVMYETINSELHEELPMVYEKKMKNLLMTLQNYFSLEAQFHSNAGKLFATSSDVIDDIPPTTHHHQHQHQHHHHLMHHHHSREYSDAGANKAASAGGSTSGMGSSGADSSLESDEANSETNSGSPELQVQDHSNGTVSEEVVQELEDEYCRSEDQAPLVDGDTNRSMEVAPTVGESEIENLGKELSEPSAEDSCGASVSPGLAPVVADSGADVAADDANMECHQQQSVSNNKETAAVELSDGSNGHKEEQQEIAKPESVVEVQGKEQEQEQEKQVQGEEVAEEKVVLESSSSEQQQQQTMTVARCLHKVKTNYKYLAEDVDELCFEADEIIQVVEFEAGQDQEEGWLMGVREVNGQRGLFPANFTHPLAE